MADAAARGVDGASKNFHTSHDTTAKPKILQQRKVVSMSIIFEVRGVWMWIYVDAGGGAWLVMVDGL